jgi:hypothetical protein
VLANKNLAKTVPAALAAAAALAAWLAGCTSDTPNEVGAGLVDARMDSALIELPVRTVTAYGPLEMVDANVPVHRQQVLYLGEQNGVKSRFLVNFDLADIFTDDYPAELFTAANIKSVKLSLTKLSHYSGLKRVVTDDGDTTWVASGQPRRLFYVVQQATTPFDSTAYVGYPGAVPSVVPTPVNSDYETENEGLEPLLRLREDVFIGWLEARQTVGLMISEGAGSDPGLIGFAARELQRYNELDNVASGTVVAPNLVIEFEDQSIVNFLLPPVADTSTFHVVPPPPPDLAAAADTILLRTCLRSYPMLDFDFSRLPRGVLINRAILTVTNDSTTAFGNKESIVVAEIDSSVIAAAPYTMAPGELGLETYLITGRKSLDPTTTWQITFDVTTLVQRLVNGVNTAPRGLLLAAPEDAYTTYDLSVVDPDFYFDEFRFYGPGAPANLRPRIQVTYSRYDDRMGGAR